MIRILLIFVMISSFPVLGQEEATLELEDETISTEDLFELPVTSPLNCIDYCFKGVCFWLTCRLWNCDIDTSIRISHRNPDFVVSAYPTLGENPWDEFRDLWGDVQVDAAATVIAWIGAPGMEDGGEAVTTYEQDYKEEANSTTFKEVDVVGWLYDFSEIDEEYFCGSNTTTLMPYYSSSFDGYLWRLGLTDVLWTPWVLWDVIGTPYLQEWGSIYWRTGFIKQLNPAKANAVLSMRAAHIASRENQGRFYISATDEPDTDQRFFLIPPGVEADGSGDNAWQMISPLKDDSCMFFDDIAEDENPAVDDWSIGRWNHNQSSSVFTVWRPYECCLKAGQSYLFSVELEICLDQ